MPLVELPTGGTMWYRKLGKGAPVLQIHGSAFGHRNFELMTPLMEKGFEVIDMDLPGYGESKGLPANSMEGIADQVYHLIKGIGYPKLHIHGTSFGAMIGMTLAARHPEVVDRLVLSCFLARYDNAARMMRSTWKRAAREIGMEAVADLTSVAGFHRAFYDLPGAQAQLQAMRDAFSKNTPEAFCAGTETIERTDLSGYVTQVKAPTLMLAGDEDNMTPFHPADSGVGFAQMKKMRPEAELVVLEKCGHYLVIEQPEAAAEKIFEFLNR
jgi:3-oxoadipate enol-lactonase